MLAAWIQILIFVLVALLVNVASWGSYINVKVCRSNLLPSGFIIGLVWTAIFGLLGYAHYLVVTTQVPDSTSPTGTKNKGICLESIAIIVVAVFCLCYTLVVRFRPMYMKFTNVLSLILAFVLGILVIKINTTAFYYILPLIVWCGFVNLTDALIVCRKMSNQIPMMVEFDRVE